MNKELELRVAKLREKYAPKQHVALTEDILDGFNVAWRKPGYGPAGKYVEEAIAVGRFMELLDAAIAAGRLEQVLDAAIDAGYVWQFWDAAVAAGQVEQVLDEATDMQKEALCDAAGV